MPTATVARVFDTRGGRIAVCSSRRKSPTATSGNAPGELLHLDLKRLARIAGHAGHRIHGDRTKQISGAGREFVHVAIDDAPRLAYVEVLAHEKGLATVAFLQRALASTTDERYCLHRSIRVLKDATLSSAD